MWGGFFHLVGYAKNLHSSKQTKNWTTTEENPWRTKKNICQIQRFYHSFRKSLNHNQLQTGKVLWEMSLCPCLLLVFFSKHWLWAMLDSTCTLRSSWSSHRVSVLFPYVYFVKSSRRHCIFHSSSVTLLQTHVIQLPAAGNSTELIREIHGVKNKQDYCK